MDKDRAREMFEDGATIMWELAKLLRMGARVLTAIAKELAYEWSNGHVMPPQPRSGTQVPHQRRTRQEPTEDVSGSVGFEPPVKWDPERPTHPEGEMWPPLQDEEDQAHLLDEKDDHDW